jgi:hypothetical protein
VLSRLNAAWARVRFLTSNRTRLKGAAAGRRRQRRRRTRMSRALG